MVLMCFAAVLLVAVLVSSLAGRTILSTAVLFLVAGFILGPETTGVLDLHAESPVVSVPAELALFAVPFTDGMRVGWTDLRSAWHLPGAGPRAMGQTPKWRTLCCLNKAVISSLACWPASDRSADRIVPADWNRARWPSLKRIAQRQLLELNDARLTAA
jgi:predicted Kef-type K+ transport protein